MIVRELPRMTGRDRRWRVSDPDDGCEYLVTEHGPFLYDKVVYLKIRGKWSAGAVSAEQKSRVMAVFGPGGWE